MSRSPQLARRLLAAGVCLAVAAVVLAACGDDDSAAGSTTTAGSGDATAATVRLGYFPNVTHAPALG